jgi:hypothetical protein
LLLASIQEKVADSINAKQAFFQKNEHKILRSAQIIAQCYQQNGHHISTLLDFAISPPVCPENPMVDNLISLACAKALIKLFEFPLVENPIKTSFYDTMNAPWGHWQPEKSPFGLQSPCIFQTAQV